MERNGEMVFFRPSWISSVMLYEDAMHRQWTSVSSAGQAKQAPKRDRTANYKPEQMSKREGTKQRENSHETYVYVCVPKRRFRGIRRTYVTTTNSSDRSEALWQKMRERPDRFLSYSVRQAMARPHIAEWHGTNATSAFTLHVANCNDFMICVWRVLGNVACHRIVRGE